MAPTHLVMLNEMNDAFSRRGFAKTAILGAAALCLPTRVLAQDGLRLRARWIVTPSEAPAGRHHGDVEVTLHVAHDEPGGVEILANAIALKGDLRVGDASHRLVMGSVFAQFRSRSRAGFRIGRKIVVPAGELVEYDKYSARLPAGLPQTRAELRLRALPRVGIDDRPEDEREGLAALNRLRGRVQVTLPG